MPMDIAFSSAAALAARRRTGKLSALELLDHDIGLENGGAPGPPHGLPMAVK